MEVILDRDLAELDRLEAKPDLRQKIFSSHIIPLIILCYFCSLKSLPMGGLPFGELYNEF